MSDKPAFLEKIVETSEGKRALAEAEAITDAMQRRFGTDDLRNKNLVELTRGLAEKVDLARVAEVIRVSYRAKNAEIFRQQDLVRSERSSDAAGRPLVSTYAFSCIARFLLQGWPNLRI